MRIDISFVVRLLRTFHCFVDFVLQFSFDVCDCLQFALMSSSSYQVFNIVLVHFIGWFVTEFRKNLCKGESEIFFDVQTLLN